MNRSRQSCTKSTEGGSALLIAILLTAVIGTLGLAALITARAESSLSVNYRALGETRASAEGTMELIAPWLAYDLRNDPDGWSNEFLFVPEPQGTPPAGLLQDTDGSVTGVGGTYYFDLRDSDGDGAADQTAPSVEPFLVPGSLLLTMIDESMYPEGSVEIRLRNLSNNTEPDGDDPIRYRDDALVLRVTAISDLVDPLRAAAEANPSVSIVEVYLGGARHSIWQNAIYSARKQLKVSKKDVVVHGSLHAVNLPGSAKKDIDYANLPPCDPDEPAIELKRGGRVVNHYDGLDAAMIAILPPLPDGSLDAELRAYGYVELDDETTGVGQPEAEAPPGSPGPLQAAYVCGQSFQGDSAGNHWEDDLDDYDVTPTELHDVRKDPYTDAVTGITYASYLDYLRGSDDGHGASALDIGYLGGKGSLDVVFNSASILDDPDKSLAYEFLDNRTKLVNASFDFAPAGTTVELFIEMEDGSGELLTYTGPLSPGNSGSNKDDDDSDKGGSCKPGKDGCPWPTGVFALLKTVPPATSGSSNPYPNGAVHALVFIPPDVQVLPGSVPILEGVFARMNGELSQPIVSPVDGGGSIPPATHGRLYGVGTMLADKNKFNDDSRKYAPLRYTGRFTIAHHDTVELTGDLLPERVFPCPDVLGVVAGKDVKVEDRVPARVAAVFWADKVEAKKGSQLAGASAVWGEFKFDEGVHIVAAPQLSACLPPGFDDDLQTTMSIDAWVGGN